MFILRLLIIIIIITYLLHFIINKILALNIKIFNITIIVFIAITTLYSLLFLLSFIVEG